MKKKFIHKIIFTVVYLTLAIIFGAMVFMVGTEIAAVNATRFGQ